MSVGMKRVSSSLLFLSSFDLPSLIHHHLPYHSLSNHKLILILSSFAGYSHLSSSVSSSSHGSSSLRPSKTMIDVMHTHSNPIRSSNLSSQPNNGQSLIHIHHIEAPLFIMGLETRFLLFFPKREKKKWAL